MRNKWIWIIIIALVLGGIGGVLLNRFGIPFLSTLPGLSWVQKLESSNPVVINRYQEVQFNEGANLVDLSKQVAAYTVSIYSQDTTPKFLGNGIITTSDGMVITSKVNLPTKGSVTVVLNDGTSYAGAVRALDPRSELAVVTISAQNLPFAQFADAYDLPASQRVIFVGRSNTSFVHDFELGQVVRTIANQSSLDRIYSSEALENTVQLSTKPASDFVGGPIANLDGKIIGMTTSSSNVLIGEDLQSAVTSFLQSSKIQRTTFGIKYLSLSDSLAKLKGLPQGGMQVVSVDSASPAQAGGLQANDLITSIDNQNLPNANFEKIINSHGATPISVGILRGTTKQTLTINLEYK